MTTHVQGAPALIAQPIHNGQTQEIRGTDEKRRVEGMSINMIGRSIVREMRCGSTGGSMISIVLEGHARTTRIGWRTNWWRTAIITMAGWIQATRDG